MSGSLEVKICGLNRPEAVDAAVEGGARLLGLNFYPPSPRSVEPGLAAELARRVPTGVRVVGVFVDPTDAEIEAVVTRVPLDMLQLHGGETPARVAEVGRAFRLPVMKAIKLATVDDLDQAAAYEAVADRLLFDAKPPDRVTALPGGNGLPFDWRILAGRSFRRPWMLSGGLTAETLAEAVAATGARAVDVSSGVEDRPGHKPPDRIAAFLEAARSLATAPA